VGDRHAKVRPECGVWHPVLSPESWHPAARVRQAVLVQIDGQQQWEPKDLPASSRRLGHQPDSERQPHA
jgi:hypothetical protein